MKPSLFSGLAAALALALCGGMANARDSDTAAAPLVAAKLQTQPTSSKEANAAVLVRDAANPTRSHIVATAALGGLEVYDSTGKRVGTTLSGEVAAVDVAYDVALGSRKATVLAAIDTTTNSLRLFSIKGPRLQEVGARPLPLGFAAEGVCLFRNSLDNALYAFIVGDGGEVDQQILFATADGKLDARQMRRINLPSTLKQCAADSRGHVYVSEEGVGVWRFNADPEGDVSARLVDAPRLGHLQDESGGVALYDNGDREWLIEYSSLAAASLESRVPRSWATKVST